VVLAHPREESLCASLSRSYAEGLRSEGIETEFLSLTDLNFDPSLSLDPESPQVLEPDLLRLRQAMERASLVCWVFPSWWAGPPAVLKGAIDRVLLPGWAYAYEGGQLPTPLLKGRTARLLLTMDSPNFWYSLVHGRSVHRAFINATLKFVGFRVKSTTLYSVRTTPRETLERKLEKIRRVAQRDARFC